MRSLTIFLTLLVVFPLIAKKNPEHLKSRVFFYKNISEEDLNDWEKDFFKDYDHEQPMSFPDMDILTDNEISDNDIAPKRKKTILRPKPNNKLETNQLVRKKGIERQDPAPDDIMEIPEIEMHEEQDVEVPDMEKKQKKPVPDIDLFPETVDDDKVYPDNEVDRSGRIRKIKELLKKRKGKRRIDKRRIY